MFKRTDSDRPFDENLKDLPEPVPPVQTAAPSARNVAAIGPSIVVRGDITGEEDLLIQGRGEGSLDLPKNDLTVGPDGKVKADLKALKIEVQGEVTGDMNGTDRIVIRRSGTVEGNIVAPRVVLEDGCRFKGSIDMSMREEEKTSGGPVLTKAPSKPGIDKVATAAADDRSKVTSVARASSTG